MTLRLRETQTIELNLRTRMPFKYGIATLRELPHLILRGAFEIDGQTVEGCAADNLPPKWFTKDPTTSFERDLVDMRAVIAHACELARDSGTTHSPFAFWKSIYDAQLRWARPNYPPLLANFGTSLIERAMIDAFCRATNQTFHHAVATNALQFALGDLHAELANARPRDFLPDEPLRQLVVRHTVGLADPLTRGDIAPGDVLNDGLPQSLEDCIRTYGLIHFKIKLAGDVRQDADRLRRLATVLHANCRNYSFSLDGNENYRTLDGFRELWNGLANDPKLVGFMSRLLFVEQPLHRDAALSDESCGTLLNWNDRPRMIIDESDDTLEALPHALACGYVGTSHKNCKGVFKSIAHACLLAHRSRRENSGRYIHSAEDLTTIGPISLLQDLAVIATLGIPGAERNGHHYLAGLSFFPESVGQEILHHHPDLYHRHEQGFPTLTIRAGALSLNSIIASPFGAAATPAELFARPATAP